MGRQRLSQVCLRVVRSGLAACGVECLIDGDDLIVRGKGSAPEGMKKDATPIATDLDHRIAMSFLVLGLAARNPVSIDDGSTIGTSFPKFAGLMRSLGADIS